MLCLQCNDLLLHIMCRASLQLDVAKELGLQFQGHVVGERKHIESLCLVSWNIIAFHLAPYVGRQEFSS